MRTDPERRHVRRTATTIGTAAVLLLVAGCTPLPPSGSSAPPSTAAPAASSATPARPAAGPLACADLLPKAEIAAALSEPHATVTATSAPDRSVIGSRSIAGAGGLSCSWSTPGTPAAPARLLTVSLLPGALDDWSAQLYGDAPTALRRTFAGVSAAAACGDPGCGASMVVGTTWVRVDLLANGPEPGGSVFGRESDDTVFANARAAIESVVTAVRQASAERLRFPSHPGGRAPDCASVLPTADLAKAMGVASAAYDTSHQPSAAADSIVGAAEQRIGTAVCFAQGSGSSPNGLAKITVDPGQAWAVADLAADAAARGPLRPTTLPGAPSGDRALTDCTPSGTTPCTVVLAVGDDAVQVEDNPRPTRIAAAIAAAVR